MSAQAKLGKNAGSVACFARERPRTPPSAGMRAHTACNIESPQLLHFMIAVEDILTIVECSPQFGQTDSSSKRCRQFTQR